MLPIILPTMQHVNLKTTVPSHFGEMMLFSNTQRAGNAPRALPPQLRPVGYRINASTLVRAAAVWRFRSPHHSCRELDMRTSEPKPH